MKSSPIPSPAADQHRVLHKRSIIDHRWTKLHTDTSPHVQHIYVGKSGHDDKCVPVICKHHFKNKEKKQWWIKTEVWEQIDEENVTSFLIGKCTKTDKKFNVPKSKSIIILQIMLLIELLKSYLITYLSFYISFNRFNLCLEWPTRNF